VIHIVEVDGDLAGFSVFQVLSAKVGVIVTIDIEPKLQGRGLGSKLMKTIERFALNRGLSAIILQVAVKNRGARKFYEKRGYAPKRLLKGYYQGSDDAWEMRLNLSGAKTLIKEPSPVILVR